MENNSVICLRCGAKNDQKPCLFGGEHQFSLKEIGNHACVVCGKPFYRIIPAQTICGRRECLIKAGEEQKP